MTYTDLDPIIQPWVQKHGLFVYTKHQEDETRCIHIVDDSGDIYNIGIQIDAEIIILHVSGKKHEYIKNNSDLSSLSEVLDDSFHQILIWIAAHGHTRTPILKGKLNR